MSTLEQTKAAILSLPNNEFDRLKIWLSDLDYQRWDEERSRDIAEGKLKALAQEAIASFEAGDSREKRFGRTGILPVLRNLNKACLSGKRFESPF